MKEYNKLVRDKIPEVIKATGKECDFEIAPKEERYKLLEAKLNEEVNEFLEDKNLEELADVMEVLFGLADSLGYGIIDQDMKAWLPDDISPQEISNIKGRTFVQNLT